MIFSTSLFEIVPLLSTLGPAILSKFYGEDRKWQNFIISLLGILFVFFTFVFFTGQLAPNPDARTWFGLSYNKISIFIGAIYCGSLFMGLYPLRKTINISSNFLFYIFGGLGIILASNLPTFFLFWCFQRFLPARDFIKQGTSGTYVFQHIMTFFCVLALMYLAWDANVLLMPMTEIPASFFTWPVLILSFIIVYESHGIFPFHSWVHDVVGKIPWYEFSAIFLCRAGVLLFVQLILPTLHTDPDLFKILLLSLSIFSSIYWSLRGFLEKNMQKTTTYFYIAQASLLLTGMQANMTAAKGSYLHMMVISFSGTAMFSILNYVQNFFGFKRSSQFYGLAQYYPKLATLFCLFGFNLIGVPLGASHVVEDLVITGLLSYQPYLGLGHIIATAINGIVFFHAFTKIFLGPTPFKDQVKNRDMTLGEMLPYLVTLLLLITIGIMPYLFLEKITW